MAISKITLNGVTQMDVTQKTVTANKMLNGITSLKNDGTDIEGDIPTKTSSDLTVSDATVTAPAGYYASDASASVAGGSATTPATTITSAPAININSNGLISINSSTQRTITPDVEAGYISHGTGGTVRVNISNTKQLDTQAAKTVTPTESEQTAVAANIYTTGIVKVGAIPSTYVGSGVAQNDSDDLTVSGATVTAPAGFYSAAASASVASGTAGTPTATKGTVSNHSVTITPSVTNTTGYITGSTKTGTGVSVAASELVSGSETISRNGTFDVTNLAQVLTSFPDGFNYETGTFSPSSDVVTYNISFSRTHSTMPFYAMVVDTTGPYDSTLNSSVYMCYHNYQQAWNAYYRASTTTNVYGQIDIAYRNTYATSISVNHYLIYYSYSNTDTTDQNHPQYWVTNTGIKATTVSTAYWRTGRVYRWFAIWNSQIDPAWEIGGVDTSTGANYNITNRMRTAEYIPVNPSVWILPKNGANVALIGYNSSHQFVEATSWVSSGFILQQKVSSMTNASSIAYVRIMGCYSDNADITDIDDLIADIEITGMT